MIAVRDLWGGRSRGCEWVVVVVVRLVMVRGRGTRVRSVGVVVDVGGMEEAERRWEMEGRRAIGAVWLLSAWLGEGRDARDRNALLEVSWSCL